MFDRDKVDLKKVDGSGANGIVANVAGSDLIVIRSNKYIIDVGDLLTRKLSNGGEETYQVIDPKYYETTPGSSGPHYQLKVKKLGVPEARAAFQHIVYNVTGNNARVNVDSVDNSTNIVNVHAVGEQIEVLRKEIEKLDVSPVTKTESLEVLDAVEEHLVKDKKPKRSVVMALLDSLPKVASITASVAKIADLF